MHRSSSQGPERPNKPFCHFDTMRAIIVPTQETFWETLICLNWSGCWHALNPDIWRFSMVQSNLTGSFDLRFGHAIRDIIYQHLTPLTALAAYASEVQRRIWVFSSFIAVIGKCLLDMFSDANNPAMWTSPQYAHCQLPAQKNGSTLIPWSGDLNPKLT